MGFPDSLGATEFVVKMCDGNSFKMELAFATLTKAHDAVVLHYSITFGKGGGQLLPDRNTDVRSIISANVPLLGEDASCSEAFGEEFTFLLGDSMVGLALDKESRSVATIERAKGGYALTIPVPISKLRSYMSFEGLFGMRPLMWTPPAILNISCVNARPTGIKEMPQEEDWRGYGFYLHLPLCYERLWDLRKELNAPEKREAPPVSATQEAEAPKRAPGGQGGK
jgi:hypothetical protein